MRTRIASWLAIFLVGLPLVHPQNLIAIGASRSDVRSELGPPQYLYSTSFQKFMPLSEEGFLRESADNFRDVYETSGGSNAFRIEVAFAPDPSLSRLHPTERVIRVDFTPDKNEPFDNLLDEIPEARALCKRGCDVQGELVAGLAGVFVCRVPRSADEQLIMEAAAGEWNKVSPDPYEWCAVVAFDGTYEAPRGKHPQFPWRSLRVDKIQIGPALRPSDQHLSFSYGDVMQDLGNWTSESRLDLIAR